MFLATFHPISNDDYYQGNVHQFLSVMKIFYKWKNALICYDVKITYGDVFQILIKEISFELDMSCHDISPFVIRGLISFRCMSNSQRNENSFELEKPSYLPWRENDAWELVSSKETYIQTLIKENFLELEICPFLIWRLISWGCISNFQWNENFLEEDKRSHLPWR